MANNLCMSLDDVCVICLHDLRPLIQGQRDTETPREQLTKSAKKDPHSGVSRQYNVTVCFSFLPTLLTTTNSFSPVNHRDLRSQSAAYARGFAT